MYLNLNKSIYLKKTIVHKDSAQGVELVNYYFTIGLFKLNEITEQKLIHLNIF